MLAPPPPESGRLARAAAAFLFPRRVRSAAGFVTSRLAPAAPALIVLAVFAAAGAAVLDDYGVSNDEPKARSRAAEVARYVLGDGDLMTDHHFDPG